MAFLSLFKPSNIVVNCSMCGRKIGMKEKRMHFNTPDVPKGMTLWICEECSHIKGKAIILPDGRVKIRRPDGVVVDTPMSKEHKMRCNNCGHTYCFTMKDIEENIKNAKKAALSSVTSIAGTMSGHYATAAVSQQNAENQLNQIVDYEICPKCHSRDIIELSDEEIEAEKSCQGQKNNPASGLSSADEIKKFKELLDAGVITENEFNTKKKELLGL